MEGDVQFSISSVSTLESENGGRVRCQASHDQCHSWYKRLCDRAVGDTIVRIHVERTPLGRFVFFYISLTLLAFLFPWRATFAPPTRKEFRIACKCGGHEAPAVGADRRDDAEEEPQLPEQSPSVQLRERMLA